MAVLGDPDPKDQPVSPAAATAWAEGRTRSAGLRVGEAAPEGGGTGGRGRAGPINERWATPGQVGSL